MSDNDKNSKITYVDFKSMSKDKKKPQLSGSFHSNPVMDRLFKLVHTKLSDGKDNYKSFSEFKPEDLV